MYLKKIYAAIHSDRYISCIMVAYGYRFCQLTKWVRSCACGRISSKFSNVTHA